jgi:membrane protein DedA with SNARE-associated domain
MDMDPVASLVGWIAVYGAWGLVAVGLAERFVPLLPSYALLLAVGAAAAEGVWLPSEAILATTLGSVLGCAACFLAVTALGATRAARLVDSAGELFGMPTEGVEQRIAALRRNGAALAFALQLVPTARLLAPGLAALLQARPANFLAASSAGIAVWNGLFIGAGYLASNAVGNANATLLALVGLGCLLAAQARMIWSARRIHGRRRAGGRPC